MNFEKNDRASDYVANQLMKGDFKKVLENNEEFELLNLKTTSNAFKKSGYQYLGKSEAAKMAEELQADFVIWGSVSSVSNTEFKLQVNIFHSLSQDLFPISFNVSKNTKERIGVIRDNLLVKMIEFAESAIRKYMDIGIQQLESKNYTSAEESFLELLKLDAENVDAFLYIGLIKFLNQDYEGSVDYYLQGLEIAPDNITILDYLSKSYLKMEDYSNAVDALIRIADYQEDNKVIWYRIGNIYLEMEYYDDAQQAYEQAIEIDPDYSAAHLALGVMLFDQDFFEAAIKPLEYATNAFPDVDHLQRKLATCYMRTGKLDAAITRYKNVLAENPENLNAYMNLANAYRVTGQNQDALNTLLKLKNLRPDLPIVYLRLADVYLNLKNYAKAEESANIALDKNPENYEPYLIKAQVNFFLGYQKYEKFLWYEEEYKDKSKYYGEAADKLVEDRDKVKQEAYDYFLAEEKLLDKAQEMTQDPSTLKDIKNKKDILIQLKNATRPGGF